MRECLHCTSVATAAIMSNNQSIASGSSDGIIMISGMLR